MHSYLVAYHELACVRWLIVVQNRFCRHIVILIYTQAFPYRNSSQRPTRFNCWNDQARRSICLSKSATPEVNPLNTSFHPRANSYRKDAGLCTPSANSVPRRLRHLTSALSSGGCKGSRWTRHVARKRCQMLRRPATGEVYPNMFRTHNTRK
jgi:hypothetical protein